MKIIMLDVDGVLNSARYSTSLGNKWDGNQLDPQAIIKLNKLTDITRARLVVSATWRLDYPSVARYATLPCGFWSHWRGVRNDSLPRHETIRGNFRMVKYQF